MLAPRLKTQTYKTGSAGRRIVLCLLLSVLVLCGGNALRQKLGVPPIFSLLPHAAQSPNTPQNTPEPQYSTCEITLQGRSWYALQLGAFTQENAAHQLSQEFIPRGAAGYVCGDGDIFRVYAAAYPTRSEAQSVQTRLSDQGVSTYIQPCNEPKLTLRATGTQSQLNAVNDIFTYLDGLSMKLFTLSSQLDKSEITVSQAQSALSSESATCRALIDALAQSFSGAIPAAAQHVQTLLDNIALSCENIQNNQSAARTGAALKSSQLCVIVELSALSKALAAQ